MQEEEVEEEEQEEVEEAAQKSMDDEGNERSQAADRVDIEIDDIEPDLHAPADDDDDDDDDDASPGDFTGEGPMKVLLEAVFKRLQKRDGVDTPVIDAPYKNHKIVNRWKGEAVFGGLETVVSKFGEERSSFNVFSD